MWHTKNAEDAARAFGASLETGFSFEDARERLSRYGANTLPQGKRDRWWNFLLHQFTSPLVYILLAGAILTLILSQWVDALVILLAVTVNVAVGFWQEFRSNSILEELTKVIKTSALVMRAGSVHEIDSEEIVPGDILVLKPGQKVSADARLIEAKHLEADEALLTGESSPQRKDADARVLADAVVGDRENMVYMGTVISGGEGKAIVVSTGGATELGNIAKLTVSTKSDPTPLQRRVADIGRFLATVVGFAVVLIMVVGLLEGHSFKEMFTTAIAVAVAAVPEGMPAAISIVLAVAAQRVLKQNGVIKRLVSAETLGSTTVICTDKTGTLTEGKMEVEKVTAHKSVQERAIDILALANEAIIDCKSGKCSSRGEITDQAKMNYFLENRGSRDELENRYKQRSLLPFVPSIKYIAGLYNITNSKKILLALTGAPETTIDLSTQYISHEGEKKRLSKIARSELIKEYQEAAGLGYRVIAIAEKVFTGNIKDDDLQDAEVRKDLVKSLTFIGFAFIRDPVRADSGPAIAEARKAGIRTIMLTGDHMLTARSIGEELGFDTSENLCILGEEIDRLDDVTLKTRLRTLSVGARVDPSHKMRIVDLLRQEGEVVAMTGDGVNDAPSLKAADIGVALGAGTDIAKSASDLILLNNSFSVIVSAVKQGRVAYDNIKKIVVFLLSGSFTELILVMTPLFLAIFLDIPIPIPVTAAMMLWTNLVEDSLPNIALAFEPAEKDVMNRPPIKSKDPVLDAEAKSIIFIVGIFTDLVLLGLYLGLYFLSDIPQPYLQTLIFAGLGFDTFFYIFSIKSLRRPVWKYSLFNNRLLIGAVILGVSVMIGAIYLKPLQFILGTVPLAPSAWLIIFTIGIIEIVALETAKWWFFGKEACYND